MSGRLKKGLGAGEELGVALAQSQAGASHGGVDDRIGLRLVDRGDAPTDVQLDGHTGDVESDEVRHQPHHRPRVAVGERPVALDVDKAPQPRGRTKPQQPALEDAATEPREHLATQALALGHRHAGETQLEVAHRHAPTRSGHMPQHAAYCTA